MSGYTIQQFSGCTSLEEVVIPEGFTKIDRSMFNGCTSLTDVTIPASAKSVDDEAFNGCTSLRTVTFTGSEPPTISSGTFGTNIEFIVPEGSEDAYQTALNTATGGTVSINDYVVQIGSDKFLTLADAIAAAQDGDTITLINDVTDTVTIDRDISIILDLDEFSLGGPDVETILTINSGNITIKATSGGITGTGNAIMVNGANTVLLITGGEISGKNGVVVNGNATVKMTGGSVVANAYALMTPIDNQGLGHIEFGGDATLTAAGGIIVTNKSTV